jgi:hypothetical protein
VACHPESRNPARLFNWARRVLSLAGSRISRLLRHPRRAKYRYQSFVGIAGDRAVSLNGSNTVGCRSCSPGRTWGANRSRGAGWSYCSDVSCIAFCTGIARIPLRPLRSLASVTGWVEANDRRRSFGRAGIRPACGNRRPATCCAIIHRAGKIRQREPGTRDQQKAAAAGSDGFRRVVAGEYIALG